jgi:hypothetical protein
VQHACPYMYGELVPVAGLCGGGSTLAVPERLRQCYTRSCVVPGAGAAPVALSCPRPRRWCAAMATCPRRRCARDGLVPVEAPCP